MLPQASTETRARLIQHFLIRALHDWEELDSAGISVRTAVNANVDVLTNVDLTGLVRQNRPRSTSWPGLILEISENEVIRDLNLAHEIATQLRIYDITLAISNFGAGFSSFERLRELPFSELKLHPGFVAGCADDARNAGICRASIELAHRFEVMTVADGLDNASTSTRSSTWIAMPDRARSWQSQCQNRSSYHRCGSARGRTRHGSHERLHKHARLAAAWGGKPQATVVAEGTLRWCAPRRRRRLACPCPLCLNRLARSARRCVGAMSAIRSA
jgi:hypothetical protein